MTWEELCKKIDPDNVGASGEWIEFGKITFWNDGAIEVYFEDDVKEIAKGRTPEQMYQIMEALIDKDISVPSKGENEKIQKQLNIATKALKRMIGDPPTNFPDCETYIWEALQALKEMEEIK